MDLNPWLVIVFIGFTVVVLITIYEQAIQNQKDKKISEESRIIIEARQDGIVLTLMIGFIVAIIVSSFS